MAWGDFITNSDYCVWSVDAYTNAMTKTITYSISSKFYWLFVIVGIGAYAAVAVPYVTLLIHNSDLYYAAPNQTIGAGYALMPLIMGGVAAVLTRRRGILRAWFGVMIGLLWLFAWTLLLGLAALLAPSQYEVANNICLATATFGVGLALWFDRRTQQPRGWLRNWRVLSAAAFAGVLLLSPLADVVIRSLNGQVDTGGTDAVAPLYVAVVIIGLLTVLIFRRMPAIQVTKRLLLLFALIMLSGICMTLVASILPTTGPNAMGLALLFTFGVVVISYIVGVWLLRPERKAIDA